MIWQGLNFGMTAMAFGLASQAQAKRSYVSPKIVTLEHLHTVSLLSAEQH